MFSVAYLRLLCETIRIMLGEIPNIRFKLDWVYRKNANVRKYEKEIINGLSIVTTLRMILVSCLFVILHAKIVSTPIATRSDKLIPNFS